jgi:hypothetical protein
LFGKPQVRSRLGEVIRLDIVAPSGTGRRGRSSRVDSSLWAIEKTRIWLCTFGTKTAVVDFGFGGIQLVVSQQDNWIFYTVSEEIRV